MEARGVKHSSPPLKAVSFFVVLSLVIFFTATVCASAAAAATSTMDGAVAIYEDEPLAYQQRIPSVVTITESGNARQLLKRFRKAHEENDDDNGDDKDDDQDGSVHTHDNDDHEHDDHDHEHDDEKGPPFYVSSAQSAISCTRLFALVVCHFVVVLLLGLPGVRA